ncbi:MAG: hypothetical protein L0227_16140 [Chloroflexi bacterium]|nr:hypothetical protein [Chloroflexota bacterium]
MFASRARPSRWVRPLAALAMACLPLLAPARAAASCIPPVPGETPWAAADVVLLGTVTATANNNRWATVHVEEVWAGPDQPVEVVVRGGPEGDVATSVDRTYMVGSRYVFGVSVVDGELQDSACSGTTLAADIDLDAMRPADVRPPLGGGTETVAADGLDLGAIGGPLAIVAVIGGLILATVLLARRREA